MLAADEAGPLHKAELMEVSLFEAEHTLFIISQRQRQQCKESNNLARGGQGEQQGDKVILAMALTMRVSKP